MANRLSVGLGALTQQPAYARTHTNTQRYAARFYRPIIVAVNSLIMLVAAIQYLREVPAVSLTLFLLIAFYLLVFLVRLRFLQPGNTQEKRFYQPQVQFLRGQLSLLAVAVMLFVIAVYDLQDHNLWVLFLLATLIISEHNSTRLVLFTLVEVAAFILFIHYAGWAINVGPWNRPDLFLQQRWYQPAYQILGVWLVNFIFHYLMRNIHGRNKAYEQREQWLRLVAEQWANKERPEAQRQAVLECADNLTSAEARLWIPRLRDGQLVDLNGQPAPTYISAAGKTHDVYLFWSEPIKVLRVRLGEDVVFNPETEAVNTELVRIVYPFYGLDEPERLIGILELVYLRERPNEFELINDLNSLKVLVAHARLVLIVSLQHEEAELEKRLSAHLNTIETTDAITRQMVQDVVEEYGFDAASVSLVDLNEKLVRGVAGRNAPWHEDSVHPLNSTDIQSETVRSCQTQLNDGQLAPNLNRRIWRKYKHRHLTRIWAPIPYPSDPLCNQYALGTIEASFRHANRETIPHHLIVRLESYARLAGIALNNAQNRQEQESLTDSLIELHDISRDIQTSKAYYEPFEMIQLVSNHAQKLLRADIIMLYTRDEEGKQLTLAYVPNQEEVIWGPIDRLKVALDEDSFLAQLCRRKQSYYQPDARTDPNLVNLDRKKDDGDGITRTFTQRQNVKSFAGIPLVGKSKRCIGLLCINYRRRRRFSDSERQIIELFAEQATLALEETYQHRHARTIAIAQERSNLGVELHHNLSQNLHGLYMSIKASQVYAERQNLIQTQSALHNTRNIAELSLEAVENMLTHLNGKAEPDTDFEQELRHQIDLLETVYDTRIHLEPMVNRWVPRQIQFYLLRIAWEALNNAVRHSRCENIHICYHVEGSTADLLIVDDGLGFDVRKARESGRYGLSAMDYFAHQLNSHLNIDSQVGQGTRIEVTVDLPSQEPYE